jgi:Fis family transcriptional regulator
MRERGWHAPVSRARLANLPLERAPHLHRPGACDLRAPICFRTPPALNAAERIDTTARTASRAPLRDHVATSVRRYLGDLNGSGADNLYEIALRELEIPLFVEVLNHCDGNQSRAAGMLGIHRATLRRKLRDYGIA